MKITVINGKYQNLFVLSASGDIADDGVVDAELEDELLIRGKWLPAKTFHGLNPDYDDMREVWRVATLKEHDKTEKKEVFVTSIPLDTYKEYSLEEIAIEADRAKQELIKYYTMNPNMALITHFRIKAELSHEYGDTYCEFNINYYRSETDEELENRIKKEAEAELKRIEIKEKNQQKALAKKKEQEALLADPEYQKFLELQSKFVKKVK